MSPVLVMSTNELVNALRARVAELPEGVTFVLYTLTLGLYTGPVSEVAGVKVTDVVAQLLDHVAAIETELEAERVKVLNLRYHLDQARIRAAGVGA